MIRAALCDLLLAIVLVLLALFVGPLLDTADEPAPCGKQAAASAQASKRCTSPGGQS